MLKNATTILQAENAELAAEHSDLQTKLQHIENLHMEVKEDVEDVKEPANSTLSLGPLTSAELQAMLTGVQEGCKGKHAVMMANST